MTFLKKLGLGLAKAKQAIAIIRPFLGLLKDGERIGAGVDRVDDTLGQVAGVVVTVEGIGAALKLDGAQKLSAASPMVTQLILQSSLVSGRKIADEAKFAEGVAKVTAGVVDILNSISADEAPAV
jgi:hypothetical protein